MRSLFAMAKITFLDTWRQPAFRIASLVFIAAGALGAVPFSPGIAADPQHYLDAGISTLYMGGVFLCLAVIPLLVRSGRGHGVDSALLCLPMKRLSLVTGLFSGFASLLILYFLAGAVVQSTLLYALGFEPSGVASGLFHACFASLVVSSLVIFVSTLMSFVPAVVCSLLIILFGYGSPYFYLPIGISLPALYALDPLSIQGKPGPDTLLPLLHGLLLILVYLSLTVYALRKSENHRAFTA